MGNFGGYGWSPPIPDKRNLRFAAPPVAVPAMVDLRPKCPPIYDQGDEGSCTANAACAAWEFDAMKQGIATSRMSRNFTYYNARTIDGDPHSDSGSSVMGVNKGLAKWGVCSEAVWPYTDSNMLKQPPAADYTLALPNAISSYATVGQDAASMKAVLASGLPIQIGFTVYSSFEGHQAISTGVIPMPAGYPNNITEGILGGHAVLIVGYDDSHSWFITRNSWGTGVMDKGYFYMPYQYFLDTEMASDLWVINAVPGAQPTPIPVPPQPTPGSGILLTDAFLNANGYTKKP